MSQATTSKMPLAGPTTQTELSTIENGILDALYSCHSGTSRPSYAVAGTVWLDTTGVTVDGVDGIYVLNVYDGADDIPLIYVDPTNNRFWLDESAPEITIASAATTDVLGAKSPRVYVTGNSGPITSLGDTPNKMVWVRFEDDITLTHSASLTLPGGVDLNVKAGDIILFASDSDGVPSVASPAAERRLAALEDGRLGWGQTWQNMTASRTYDTAYQNTTGRPITVVISSRSNSSSVTRSVQVSADGTTWVAITNLDINTRGPKPATIILPAGHYIRIVGAWDVSNSYWAELR